MTALVSGIFQAVADFRMSTARIEVLSHEIDKNTSLALDQLHLKETQQSGATVLLTGFLEEYLKNVVKEFINALCITGLPFENLPDRIKQLHFEGGGLVLHHVVKKEIKKQPQFFRGGQIQLT